MKSNFAKIYVEDMNKQNIKRLERRLSTMEDDIKMMKSRLAKGEHLYQSNFASNAIEVDHLVKEIHEMLLVRAYMLQDEESGTNVK